MNDLRIAKAQANGDQVLTLSRGSVPEGLAVTRRRRGLDRMHAWTIGDLEPVVSTRFDVEVHGHGKADELAALRRMLRVAAEHKPQSGRTL